jgi:hypothetical protein
MQADLRAGISDMRREDRDQSPRRNRENTFREHNRDDRDSLRKREDHYSRDGGGYDSRRSFDRYHDRRLDDHRDHHEDRSHHRDSRVGLDDDRRGRYEERRDDARRYDDRHLHRHDGSRNDGPFRGRGGGRGPKPRQDPLLELPPSKIRVSELNADPELRPLADDPRIDSNGIKHRKERGGARNTESFDPASTLVRPDMRIIVGPQTERFGRSLKHDDVVVVPNFFCEENDWTLYYQLVEEMREIQEKGVPQSEWTAWAEGAHLISHNPSQSRTFQMVFCFFTSLSHLGLTFCLQVQDKISK